MNIFNNKSDGELDPENEDQRHKDNLIQPGGKAIDFESTFIDSSFQTHKFKLSEIKNPIILFFYPKDNTPGCSYEAKAFSNKIDEFKKLGVEIFGISNDKDGSHENFIRSCGLSIPLIVDKDNSIAKMYGLVKQKSLFGIEYNSISRTTFLIDTNLKIIEIWRDVSILSHVGEVFACVEKLSRRNNNK